MKIKTSIILGNGRVGQRNSEIVTSASHIKVGSNPPEAKLSLFYRKTYSSYLKEIVQRCKYPTSPIHITLLNSSSTTSPVRSEESQIRTRKSADEISAGSSHWILCKPDPRVSHILTECELLRRCVCQSISAENDRDLGGMEGREVRNDLRI